MVRDSGKFTGPSGNDGTGKIYSNLNALVCEACCWERAKRMAQPVQRHPVNGALSFLAIGQSGVTVSRVRLGLFWHL